MVVNLKLAPAEDMYVVSGAVSTEHCLKIKILPHRARPAGTARTSKNSGMKNFQMQFKEFLLHFVCFMDTLDRV